MTILMGFDPSLQQGSLHGAFAHDLIVRQVKDGVTTRPSVEIYGDLWRSMEIYGDQNQL